MEDSENMEYLIIVAKLKIVKEKIGKMAWEDED